MLYTSRIKCVSNMVMLKAIQAYMMILEIEVKMHDFAVLTWTKQNSTLLERTIPSSTQQQLYVARIHMLCSFLPTYNIEILVSFSNFVF